MRSLTPLTVFQLVFALALFLALGLPSSTSAEATEQTLAENQVELRVDGMSCGACASTIEKQIGAREEVESVAVNVKNKQVIVSLKPGSQISDADLRADIDATGFQLEEIKRAG